MTTERAPSISVLQKQLAKHREQAQKQLDDLNTLKQQVLDAIADCEERLQKLNDVAKAF